MAPKESSFFGDIQRDYRDRTSANERHPFVIGDNLTNSSRQPETMQDHGRQQAWARGRHLLLPLDVVKCFVRYHFLCISSYSQTLSRPIISTLFSQFLEGRSSSLVV